MGEAEQERHKNATCAFLQKTYGIHPNISWGSLDDKLLRQWWNTADCNNRVKAVSAPSKVHFTPLPPHHHQHPLAALHRQDAVAVVEKQRELLHTVYFTSYGTSAMGADFDGINRVCFAFLGIDASGGLTGGDSVNARQLLAAKLRAPIKVLASVGGWGNCSNFSRVFADLRLRGACVASCRQLLFNGWDGIDLDWEFPTGPADAQNMLSFFKELREVYPKALLTIAASSNVEYYRSIAAELSKVLDSVYVMTYDYIGPWGSASGHNSSVADSVATIQKFVDAGFPPGKLSIGSAWYGRMCKVTSAQNNGLAQTCLSGEWSELTYNDVATAYLGRRGFTKYWDKDAEASWLFNGAERTFVSYEDEAMVRVKRTQAKLKGLQGIFCWAYAHDSKGVLKNALVGGI